MGSGTGRAPVFCLSSDKNYFETNLDYTNVSGSLSLWLYYQGGYVRISKVTVRETPLYLSRLLCIFVVLFLGIDLLILFRKKVREKKKEIIFLCGVIFVTSIPLFHFGINYGHDLQFHLMRIEGLSSELSRGNFWAYILSDCVDGYGYPVSIYYSNFFLYLPAFLRNIGFSLTDAYKILLFTINVGTVVVAYVCFLKMFKSTKMALLSSLLYAACPYRLMDAYVRSALGEFTAIMVLPLIAYALWNMYYESEEETRNNWINTCGCLVLGISGLIQSHILSTEMVAVFVLGIALVFIKRTFRKVNLKIYACAFLMTFLVNAAFLVPFIDYYFSQETMISVIAKNVSYIQPTGAYITQLFSFFESPFGYGDGIVIENRMQITLGIPLMSIALGGVICSIVEKKRKIICVSLINLFLLWISTNLFPWDYLSEHIPFFNIIATIQYPWRFLAISMVGIVVLLGIVNRETSCPMVNGKRSQIFYYLLISGVMTCLVFISGYVGGGNTISPYDENDLDMKGSIINGEYLLYGTDLEQLTGEYETTNVNEFKIISDEGTKKELYVVCDDGGEISVPLFNYKGYRAVSDSGSEIEIETGNNNQIIIKIPDGYEGNIQIDYVARRLWVLARYVSIVSICMLLIGAAVRIKWKKSIVRL